MPTAANSAKPRLKRAKFPFAVREMVRSIRRCEANPQNIGGRKNQREPS
jgi:hypothetical protein